MKKKASWKGGEREGEGEGGGTNKKGIVPQKFFNDIRSRRSTISRKFNIRELNNNKITIMPLQSSFIPSFLILSINSQLNSERSGKYIQCF